MTVAIWDDELAVGSSSTFTKTVGEVDVVLFAGLTGDLHPVHIDSEYMRSTPYGGRLVHGVFLLGLISTAGALLTGSASRPTVSVGYRNVNFLRPVFIGDTIAATYTVKSHDRDRSRAFAHAVARNQRGEAVVEAVHELKVIEEAAKRNPAATHHDQATAGED